MRCTLPLFALSLAIATGLAAAEGPLTLVADKDYPPLIYLDRDVPKGMFVDLTRALSKKMGREIRIELMAWDQAQKETVDGHADIVGPMAHSKQRDELFDFSQSCLTCEYSLFVRDNEMSIRSVDDLAGVQVGVTTGGYPRQLLAEKSGVELVLVENYGEGIELLRQGKIRVLAADRWVGAYYIQERGVQGISILDKPMAVRELAYAVKKGNTALLNKLNRGLSELRAEGATDAIAGNWEPKKVVILTQENMRRSLLLGGCVLAALLIAALSIWIHLLRREVRQRRRAEAELAGYRGQLEDLVRQRTDALEKEITERKRIEEALRLAKDGADAASNAKSAFLASMSHEIRTPLNAILGYAHLLKRDIELSKKHTQALASISSSGEHLLDLLSDILAMSSIEAGRTTLDEDVFDLHELLRTLESMFSLRVREKGLVFSVEMEPGLPRHVSADQRKLRQILFNLLSNAVRFSDRGTVTLRVRARDGVLEFDVEDSGPGMSPAEQAALFRPFSQTESGRRKYGGAGLGLAISRGFVELMGGHIGVRSEPGKGSCFQFSVRARRVEKEPSLREPDQIVRLRSTLKPPRVLVVEDHPESRKLLIELQRSAGFDVRGAGDGREAIRIWDEWRPHFIWMDMNLPVLDGYQSTREILAKDATKQTVIVALTASVFEEDRARILASGCADFMTKPFSEQAIFACLEKHLHVEYEREATPPSGNESLETIAAKMEALPKELFDRIRRHTRMLDAAALTDLADNLAAEHPVVSQFLKHSAEQLDFAALEAVISSHEQRASDSFQP